MMFRSGLLLLATFLAAPIWAASAQTLPPHIALLLPQSGRMAKAAETIRDGFLAAYYQDTTEHSNIAPPLLSFYDSDSGNLLTLLQEAQQNGATLLIGPLDRDRVESLLKENLTGLPPLLTLNSTEASAPQVYQFALSPEDEIRRLVSWMQSQNITRPLILLSHDATSQRQLRLFQSYWASNSTLPTLILDASRKGGLFAAIKELQQTSSHYDAIFLASPALANQIMPSLRYFNSRLPLYSLSSAWTPTANGSSQRDLEGLRFCDLPWMLEPPRPEQVSIYQVFTQPSSNYDRLYAFGADAWSIAQQWTALQDGESLSLRSGLIQADKTGHLNRIPTCAEVRNGIASPLWLSTDSADIRSAGGNSR